MPERIELFRATDFYGDLVGSHTYIDELGDAHRASLYEVNTMAEVGYVYQCWVALDLWTFVRRRYRPGMLNSEEIEMRHMQVPTDYGYDQVVELASLHRVLPGDV